MASATQSQQPPTPTINDSKEDAEKYARLVDRQSANEILKLQIENVALINEAELKTVKAKHSQQLESEQSEKRRLEKSLLSKSAEIEEIKRQARVPSIKIRSASALLCTCRLQHLTNAEVAVASNNSQSKNFRLYFFHGDGRLHHLKGRQIYANFIFDGPGVSIEKLPKSFLMANMRTCRGLSVMAELIDDDGRVIARSCRMPFTIRLTRHVQLAHAGLTR